MTATMTPPTHSLTPTRPMSPDILLLTELFPPFVGGSAVLYEGIYSRLSDKQIVVLTDVKQSAGPDKVRGNLWIERRDISSEYWGLLKLSAFKQHWRIASYVKELANKRDTVVHCGRTLPEGLAAYMSRKRGGPRYACWAHGEDITLQVSASREMRMWTGKICHGAEAIFANSENTKNIVADTGVPRDKIHVIYPGVDADEFRPENDGTTLRDKHAPNGEPFIVSIGRLERRKGFDLTLKAVAKLRQSIPNIRYALVGGGPDLDYLKNMANELDIDKNVDITGRLPFEDLPRYYAACDVFVHPNRIEGVDVEGFGIVFLEAAATERPTIGGNTGGVPEAVAENETGLLVSGTDVDELADAIRRLLDSPQLREQMGRAGRKRVLERFTWDATAGSMRRLLNELNL